ncbi:MFS transporter [Salinispirillum marinum]|uniref:MFS transporter n=2 Tax=Saccharospirillaceae TaxID=255527 RepID=A0ABV8BJH1_9GAMM
MPDTTSADALTTSQGRPSMRALFAVLGFRRYFLASAFSTFAIWITRFLLGWMAWALTESAFWVGVVSALFLAPTFLLSLLFGVVADRVHPLRGMWITTGAQAVIGLVATGASVLGVLQLPLLCLIAACIGIVTAAHHPLRMALLPLLVARQHFTGAIGLASIVFNTSRILGPALGALLLWLGSPAWAFGVASGLYCATLAALLRVPVVAPERTVATPHLWRELAAGLGVVRQSPTIRIILLLTMINGLFGRTLIEMLPAISGQLLQGDAGTLAMLTSVAGAGSIMGGLIISRQRGTPSRLAHLVLLSVLLGAAVMLPVWWIHTGYVLATQVFVLALSMTIIGTGCQTTLQLMVDDAFRGRVMSIWTVISMGMPAAGALLLGALADSFGLPVVITVFALLVLLIALTLRAPQQRLFAETKPHEET